VFCSDCSTESLILEARFCRKCGAALPTNDAPKGDNRAARWLALPFFLIGRAISYPIKLRQERRRWLAEASGPDSPINYVLGLSDNTKWLY
jgi:hypothetical protein